MKNQEFTTAEQALRASILALPDGHMLVRASLEDSAKTDFISYKADFTSNPSNPVTFGDFPAPRHLKQNEKQVTGQVTGTSNLTPENNDYCVNIAHLRAELTRLHDYIIRLRCADPPKGTRLQALAWLTRQIEKLSARSADIGGTENGWTDPADVFADMDQIEGLRAGLAELTRADAPYPVPLPDGCVLLPSANFDPFAHGRLYNGMIAGHSIS